MLQLPFEFAKPAISGLIDVVTLFTHAVARGNFKASNSA